LSVGWFWFVFGLLNIYSLGDKFSYYTLFSKTYLVSHYDMKMAYSGAANACQACFNYRLADISRSLAQYGSLSKEEVLPDRVPFFFMTNLLVLGWRLRK
jgi:hypothetical protein